MTDPERPANTKRLDPTGKAAPFEAPVQAPPGPPKGGGKGGQKGRGKGKPKRGTVPSALVSKDVVSSKWDSSICFDVNMSGCDRKTTPFRAGGFDGGRCEKGVHVCMGRTCNEAHAASKRH